METIRNYLESMFAQLPNTPEVWNAKNELSQMMEDKYNELRAQGKSDNEAVGIVISEFGNLDELAESLGIQRFMGQQVEQGKIFEESEAKKLIRDMSRAALIRGIGIFFFIICCVGPIIGCAIGEEGFGETMVEPMGVASLFIFIALGVGLCIVAGTMDSKWSFLKKGGYRIDYQTAEEVGRQMENYRMTNSLMKAIGVAFCVLCCVPVIVMTYGDNSNMKGCLGGAAIFFMVGIGVMLMVASSGRMAAFRLVLGLNDKSTIAGSYVPGQQENKYSNETVAKLMSVYWPTVTAVYLIYSFLTFYWWKSWIIWPIAAVIQAVINSFYGVNNQGGDRR